jgi:enterochelin esterase-like enzyme
VMADPGNPHIKPQRSPRTSILDVPGPTPLLTQWRDVPHGAVHVHHYKSKTTGSVRRLHVYTPPGYETQAATKYPTMYLLHGRGDNDGAWSVHGRAHFILDNLIAEGKTRPMVVVMTDGHVVPEQGGKEIIAQFKNNTDAYRRDLLTDVLPLIEARYRVRKDAQSRAIVGLSMGGNQALTVGLAEADRFAWVAGMSAAAPAADEIAKPLDDVKALNRKLAFVWIGCGKDDFLLSRNEAFVALLKEKGLRHEWQLTEGNHSWPVWRDYLAQLAPRLFKPTR